MNAQINEGAAASIDSDMPTEHDDLGRGPYVRTLARIIRTAETPLVIAIYGAWGAGKTSLMMQLRRQLDPAHDGRSSGEQVARTVWFDPWMHQFDDAPALALLHAAASQLDLPTVSRKRIADTLARIAVAIGEDIEVPFVGVRVGKLLKIREELAQDDFHRREERARMREHFHEVLKVAGATDRRIVFFIDDLDRCQPALALSLLEALKLYLDLPNCVYVLGVDREPLEAAVGAQYKTLGLRTESYLDKIIQLPFAIPAIGTTAMDAFVKRRLPTDLAACSEMLAAATADEPRNVKRLTNSLLINHELATEATFESGYDPRVLAMVVLIQNKAPDLYRQLRFDPSLIHELFRSRHDDRVRSTPDPAPPAGMWELYVRANPRLARALDLVQFEPDLDLTPYITLTSIASAVAEAPSSTTSARRKVYVSYRRADARGWAGRIADALTELDWDVVRDVGAFPGEDLLASTGEAVQTSDAMIVIIGPDWMSGKPLEEPADPIRRELERAEKLGLTIVPVLVDRAVFPSPDALPASVRFLATLNGLPMYDDSFRLGIAQLDAALRRRFMVK